MFSPILINYLYLFCILLLLTLLLFPAYTDCLLSRLQTAILYLFYTALARSKTTLQNAKGSVNSICTDSSYIYRLQSLNFLKYLLNYFQTSPAISFTSASFAHCCSFVSLFPISQEANPHCGLKHRRSNGMYFAA